MPPPDRPLRVIAFDPSITCTGWAVLEEARATSCGAIVAVGTIKPAKGGSVSARLIELANDACDLVEERYADMSTVVLEMPADQAVAAKNRRFRSTAMTGPTYGAAVGAVLMACRWGAPSAELLTPSSTDWTGGDVPSSRDDRHKTARVVYAENLWRLDRGDLGSESEAGNVADALFLARWGLFRSQWAGGVAAVIHRLPRKARA